MCATFLPLRTPIVLYSGLLWRDDFIPLVEAILVILESISLTPGHVKAHSL